MSNGDYTFANLGPGDYKVREVLRPGFELTTSTPADITGQSGLDETVNFGNFQVIAISGRGFPTTSTAMASRKPAIPA